MLDPDRMEKALRDIEKLIETAPPMIVGLPDSVLRVLNGVLSLARDGLHDDANELVWDKAEVDAWAAVPLEMKRPVIIDWSCSEAIDKIALSLDPKKPPNAAQVENVVRALGEVQMYMSRAWMQQNEGAKQ